MKLLNIGTEELKGTDELKDAAALLREADYLAVPVRRLHRGRPAVARRRSTSSSPTASPAISRSRPPRAPRASSPTCCAARSRARCGRRPGSRCRGRRSTCSRYHLDPNNHNGAVFLGLNGLVVKSHGSANAQGRRQRHPRRRQHGPQRHHPEDRRGSRQFPRPRLRRRGRAMIGARSSPALGSALPKRRVTNDELAATGRHHRRMDRRAHRHPQPLYRRRRRDDRQAWPPTRRARRSTHAGVDADRDRPDRARHRDARPDLPVDRDQGPGRARHQRLHRVRRRTRCAPASSMRCRSPIRCFARATRSKALVIGAETFSRILDWEDRATCVLFGDGAGALVLERRGNATAASSPPSSTPTAATTTCCSSTAARRPPAPSASSG